MKEKIYIGSHRQPFCTKYRVFKLHIKKNYALCATIQ